MGEFDRGPGRRVVGDVGVGGVLVRVYLGTRSANVDTGGKELDLSKGGAYCRGEEVGKGENPESEGIPTLDGVVDDFERMCFDDMDLFPVGKVLNLKKGEVAGAAAVIGKTGDDGRRGEAEAGDEVEEEEGEEEPDSEPASDKGCGGCCCWCCCCCMDSSEEPRNVECGIAGMR